MKAIWLLLSAGLLAAAQNASFPYPPSLPGANVEVYKRIGDDALSLYVFAPGGDAPTGGRSAIVFFFGGGWRNGSPGQFEGQCRRLASLGMVAITADYRVSSRNQSTVMESVRDAKSAIRYVRKNAARLGIDPHRIAGAGGSAGGHIAATAGIVKGLDEPGEDLAVSSRPDALVLFNPVLVLAPIDGVAGSSDTLARRAEFTGVNLESVSPWHHVTKGAPPSIIFHGRADTTVPYASAQAFATKMQEAGNRCELAGFEGQQHGFFNNRPGNPYYAETLHRTEEFLKSIHYLAGELPTGRLRDR